MTQDEKFIVEQVIPAQPGYYLVCGRTLEHEIQAGGDIDEVVKRAISTAQPIIAWIVNRSCKHKGFEHIYNVEPLSYTWDVPDDDNVIVAPNGYSYRRETWGATLKEFVEFHIAKTKQW